jgi:hypothetical protein
MPKLYLDGFIKRCLLLSAVGCIISLGIVGLGVALAEYRGILIEKDILRNSLAKSVSVEQIKLGLKRPIKECLAERMADWATSGRFLSRTDARSRAQKYCEFPAYLSDEYVREEAPLAFQDLWFAYKVASESAKVSGVFTKISAHSEKFKRYGIFGAYISLAFLCGVCLAKWARDGTLSGGK